MMVQLDRGTLVSARQLPQISDLYFYHAPDGCISLAKHLSSLQCCTTAAAASCTPPLPEHAGTAHN
jgi:hypothetical protein